MKKISLQTIADDFGVSKVTVHKALKNQPGVRPELKERIQSYASQIGYSTHDPIISKKHFLYIIDKKYFLSYEQFYTKIYYYLNNEIERNHGKITLLIYDGQPFYLSKIKEINGIDCILLAGETDDELMRLLGETDYPVITIDFLSNRFPFDYIYINNYYSSMLATNYLIEQGHKKIGMVVDPLSANSNTDRFFGYQKALMLNSIPYHPEWLIDRNIEHYDIKDFDLPKEMPTAFICHCDKAEQQLYTKIKSETDMIPIAVRGTR
ncbi:MAG: LacI family DNA-binding transcriptional regulator, partial [Acholeplasmataceae bacterium]